MQGDKGIEVRTPSPKYLPSSFHIPFFIFPRRKAALPSNHFKAEGMLKVSLTNESEMLWHVGLAEQPSGITKSTLCTAPAGCIPECHRDREKCEQPPKLASGKRLGDRFLHLNNSEPFPRVKCYMLAFFYYYYFGGVGGRVGEVEKSGEY